MKYEDYKNDITITGFSMEEHYVGDTLSTAKKSSNPALRINYKVSGEFREVENLLGTNIFSIKIGEIIVSAPDVKASKIVAVLPRLVFDYIYDQLLKNYLWHLEQVKKIDVHLKTKPVGDITE